jgi:type I restriction enzyme S subunit
LNWGFGVLGGVQWVPLNQIIMSLKTGLNPRKNFVLNTSGADGYYVTVRELTGVDVKFFDKTDRVSKEALSIINNRSNLEIGDILFSGTGTIGKTALIKEKPANWNIKEGVYVIKPNKEIVDSKFLLFYLNSLQAIKEYEKKIVGSPVSSIPMSELKKLIIPLPNMSEQKRIVSILDNFEALTNDISSGLPAELKARRSQYEYYRGKLLTFNEYVS